MTKSAECYVVGLGEVLVNVYRSIPESEFCGVGLLVCSDPSALPRLPLTGARCPQPGTDVVAAICGASMRCYAHDGFHILSPDWTLTHTNQYIAPPVAPECRPVVRRPGFGARHMSASLVSRLPEVICAGVLSTRKRILIFSDGEILVEFAV